ncbi:HPP family protein [Halovenus halobia]|uniref:HPP family protein n=1 Tax=Halovenus halobia TaxID=3396622 RepID=UPI003F54E8DE
MGKRWDLAVRYFVRFWRRKRRELRRWLERTNTLVHLSILLIVPILIALVTLLSNAVGVFSFLVYPPLVSGAYTLFADPEGKYASPVKFVGGLTVGALCGWVAIELTARLLYATPAGQLNPVAAGMTVFMTGLAVWVLGVEEPAAFSMALLTLFVRAQVDALGLFVLGAAVSSAIVAGTFAAWRRYIYEQRAQYLYETTDADDQVLVPMVGPDPAATAMLAARLAGAHRAGKVVLLEMVDEEPMARAERALLQSHGETSLVKSGPNQPDEPLVADGAEPLDEIGVRDDLDASVADIERHATAIETEVGVPCQVVVATAGPSPADMVLDTAREANCDLIASPYETEKDWSRELLRGDIDTIIHRSFEGQTRWRRILVPVNRANDVAHSMIDFATRLSAETGEVSVASFVTSGRERRRAEDVLADLVETFSGSIETRISRSDLEAFLTDHGGEYDLIIIGASQDRSTASRFVSPPTFENIDTAEIDADIAIVDRH